MGRKAVGMFTLDQIDEDMKKRLLDFVKNRDKLIILYIDTI